MKHEVPYDTMHEILSKITNPVIFELGMCDGYHTDLLLSLCTSKPVYYGFEPDPRNLWRIKMRELDTKINFFPDAVGHNTGPTPFHLATPDHNNMVGSSSLSEFMPVLTKSFPWLHCEGTTTVNCWRLDDFCKQHNVGHIDFIWMDVQGGERLVFAGAPDMLKRTRYIWTEYDGGDFYKDSSTVEDIQKLLPDFDLLMTHDGNALLKNTSL